MARRNQDFQAIRSEGGLLPPDLLRRVIDPKAKLEGTEPKDYGLPPGERLNESITQSWSRLRKYWADFRAAAKNLPEEEAGTGLTNDKWSVPLLNELGFGRLPTTVAPEIGGRTYAISRFFGATPVHLIGCQLDLDRRAKGVRGAAIANPHGLVQDFLNRSDAHLWAILSNGLRLRILRDSQAISRQSYLEFDLEAMFEGGIFSDFVLLWLVAHSTRFVASANERPESCWLERWTKLAAEQGTRALGDLRQGVEKALESLGQGLVSHPKNTALRDALRTGTLSPIDLHGQLLRIVYRLIFLFVAEDRTLEGLPLLHAPDESDDARVARERYAAHYSAGRLREMAGAIRGSRHGDLWWQLNLVVGALSGEEQFKAVREQLALPVLGSLLWSPDSTAALNAPSLADSDGAELANADLLEAIRNLAFTRQNHSLRPVDYRNLGAEELGGVYESLLALTPQVSGDGAKFTFAEFAGNERKTSGSYYTPDSLVQCLLDSALDPVVEEAIKGKSGAAAEQAILALKVCDPAVGSGHFLVGAAHRLARHLARIRATAQGEGEPSPGFYQHALRDVIGRCLYGVDINPMAAELCRVSLWLEALDPGKPLSFLDHHIRVGNSLLGTTRELIAGGLPDDAFTAIEGDDKNVCTQLKRKNKAEREGFDQGDFLDGVDHGVAADLSAVTREASKLDTSADDTVDAVQRKADQFRRLVVSPEYTHAQQVADTWCAAFVWPKTPKTVGEVVTTSLIQRLVKDPKVLSAAQAKEVEKLSSQYQFFHWHLAFPEVFAKGGFDCVTGNPPWERIKLQEQEFFGRRSPAIVNAANAAARKRLISDLSKTDPALLTEWRQARRAADGQSHYIRHSGRFARSARGDINTYAVFTEHNVTILNETGRAGFIVPNSIATDDTTKELFNFLHTSRALISLFSVFEIRRYFVETDSRVPFCLLTLGYNADDADPDFVFDMRDIAELGDRERHVRLSAADIGTVNPNTGTCPIFRCRRDADLTMAIYRKAGVLIRAGEPPVNPWGVRFLAMFHMALDSHLFKGREYFKSTDWNETGNRFAGRGEEYVPLYEAKMIHQFNHRYGDYRDRQPESESTSLPDIDASRLVDLRYAPHPRYWVPVGEVTQRLSQKKWAFRWLIGYRRIARSTDERTLIAAFLPNVAAADPAMVLLPSETDAGGAACILANLNSFVFDYVVRQKLGGTDVRNHYFEQFPVLPPQVYFHPCGWLEGVDTVRDWLIPRVLELSYTAWDLKSLAEDLGLQSAPFAWDVQKRYRLRCELDALYFHLYLGTEDEWRAEPTALLAAFPTPRHAVEHILNTFVVLKRRDESHYGGHFRTRDTILHAYDAMGSAIRGAAPYGASAFVDSGITPS